MFKCIETSSLLKCSDNDDIDSSADIQKNKNKIQGIPNQKCKVFRKDKTKGVIKSKIKGDH